MNLREDRNQEDEILYHDQNDYYSGYYSTGGHCRHRQSGSGIGWIAAVAGALLLFFVGAAIAQDYATQDSGFPESSEEQYADVRDAVLESAPTLSEVLTGVAEEIPETAAVGEATQDKAAYQGDAELVIQKSDSDELPLQDIYKKVIPSVVSIIADKNGVRSTGTGIIMSENGLIITNYHVASGAARIQVLLNSGEQYDAAYAGGDEISDLMVIKIDADGLIPAEFGNSDMAEVGDSVVAIGDPLGIELRGTMTDGIICGISRDVEYDGRTLTLLQTNAALNSGNSGGPLVNMRGQVIGINTMKLSGYASSTTVEGIGFAIPISTAKPIVEELVQHGFVTGRPSVGFTLNSVDVRLMYYYKLPSRLCVWEVNPASDAAAKGIRQGDVIIALQGEAVTTADEFNEIKNRYSAGDQVTMTISRKGVLTDIVFRLMDAAGSN